MSKPSSKRKPRDDRGQLWKRLTTSITGTVAAATVGVLILTASVLELIGIKVGAESVKFGVVILSLIAGLFLGHYISGETNQSK